MAPRPETHRAGTLVRRDKLLLAAVEVVAERGLGGATHREIAKRAGVPLATTSYFFGSIDELLLEALRVFSEETVRSLEATRAAIVSQGLGPVQTLDALLDVLFIAPPHWTVAQFESYLEVSRRPEHAGAVKRVISSFESLAADALEAAGARDPREGARVVVALLDGFALHRIAWPRRRAARRVLREATLDLLMAQTMDGAERAERLGRLERASV